jgi:LuxR family maltose regulon positive regulatory protein
VRRLRELLGRKGAVRHAHGRIALDTITCWVDVWAFEKALDAGGDAAVANAIDLYRGPLLPDESASWAIPVRQRLRTKFMHAVMDAGQRAEAAGRYDDALGLYRRWVLADELAEPFYQGLMRCFQRLDRLGEALETYGRLHEVLSVRGGAAPSPASERLYRKLGGL